MDALEAALGPIARVLNKNINEIESARELCRELAGSVIAIRVRDTALAAYFIVSEDHLSISTTSDDDADVIISGSLLTLAGMIGQPGIDAIRKGALDLAGDAATADQFQQLLSLARPDLEEELATVVGDVAAHRIGEMARGLGRWSRDARSTMGANIREYLQEESREVPSRYEVQKFTAAIDQLRDDVDRLEARIDLLLESR